ncbi:MAG: hypothetical protein JSW53_03835, partial [Candidatus Bathyarchaeota archaeon]
SMISPAMAFGPGQEAWYRFQVSPFSDVILLNTNAGGWLNGYNTAYEPNTPVLGKFESAHAFIACDLPPGYIEMFFIVINIARRTGVMYRITDELELIGPTEVELVPVAGEAIEGPTIDEFVDSQVTPQAWYDFQTQPYADIVHLNDELKPWLWGWVEAASSCYPAPVLGYYHAGRFYMGWDYIDNMGCYEISFWAGTVKTRDGYFTRTIDGISWVGPEYFWLDPV